MITPAVYLTAHAVLVVKTSALPVKVGGDQALAAMACVKGRATLRWEVLDFCRFYLNITTVCAACVLALLFASALSRSQPLQPQPPNQPPQRQPLNQPQSLPQRQHRLHGHGVELTTLAVLLMVCAVLAVRTSPPRVQVGGDQAIAAMAGVPNRARQR